MTFNAAKAFKNEGVPFAFEFAAKIEDFSLGDEIIQFSQDVGVKGSYTGMGSYIRVEADIQANLILVCGRCLKTYTHGLKLEVSEEYSRSEDPSHPDRYLFEGEEFDISQLIMDNLIMALPIQRLCREACKGLCPVCGNDLNEESCVCLNGMETPLPEWKQALLNIKED